MLERQNRFLRITHTDRYRNKHKSVKFIHTIVPCLNLSRMKTSISEEAEESLTPKNKEVNNMLPKTENVLKNLNYKDQQDFTKVESSKSVQMDKVGFFAALPPYIPEKNIASMINDSNSSSDVNSIMSIKDYI
jgi:hypothetical protein